MSVVTVLDVTTVVGVSEVAVIEVAGYEVSVKVVTSVVSMVTVLEGDVGMGVAWVVESVVINVDMGVVFAVKVDTGCVVDTSGEFGSTVMVDMLLVITGVEVVNVGEYTVFVGVAEDIIGGVEVASVVTNSVDMSLAGVSVVFQVDVA